MAPAVTRKIFISYRRDDSAGHAELLFRRLISHYGPTAVFRDVHSIHPMERFREVIDDSLSQCFIVLVVMSKQWARIAGPDGIARLQTPDDVVCWEIETALERAVPILPVLVGGGQMPKSGNLPESIRRIAGINALEISDSRWEQDFESLVHAINQVSPPSAPQWVEKSPFSLRGAIRDDAFFYGRARELRMLETYLRNRQNCQLVGPRRIGKSSLLLYVQRHCADWCRQAKIAYLDLQDARCHTRLGWLKEIAVGLGIRNRLQTLTNLAEAIEDLIVSGVQPILCLDEFGEMTYRKKEFTRDVFLTLRSCGQRGMSILTAAPERLSALTNPRDISSPFFNTFPTVEIGAFSPNDARAYVELPRVDVPAFTAQEIDRILEFSKCHPFALQTACFHVLSARESGEELSVAIERADQDCRIER
jgi:hypothetical protein